MKKFFGFTKISKIFMVFVCFIFSLSFSVYFIPMAIAAGDDYEIEIVGVLDNSVKYNGTDTYTVDFKVKGNNGALAQGAECVIAYDTSVFDLVSLDGTQTLSDLNVTVGTSLSLLPGSVSYLFEPFLTGGWNPLLSVAVSQDGKTAYASMQAYRMSAGYLTSLVSLQQIRLAFKENKSLNDVSNKTIRLVSAAEMIKLGSTDCQIQIIDGSNGIFEYGKRNGGPNTLSEPVISLEMDASFIQYIISASAGTGGSVSGWGVFNENENVTLIAKSNAGYIFDGWYENGEKIESAGLSYSFTALSDRILQAYFIPCVHDWDGDCTNECLICGFSYQTHAPLADKCTECSRCAAVLPKSCNPDCKDCAFGEVPPTGVPGILIYTVLLILSLILSGFLWVLVVHNNSMRRG